MEADRRIVAQVPLALQAYLAFLDKINPPKRIGGGRAFTQWMMLIQEPLNDTPLRTVCRSFAACAVFGLGMRGSRCNLQKRHQCSIQRRRLVRLSLLYRQGLRVPSLRRGYRCIHPASFGSVCFAASGFLLSGVVEPRGGGYSIPMNTLPPLLRWAFTS